MLLLTMRRLGSREWLSFKKKARFLGYYLDSSIIISLYIFHPSVVFMILRWTTIFFSALKKVIFNNFKYFGGGLIKYIRVSWCFFNTINFYIISSIRLSSYMHDSSFKRSLVKNRIISSSFVNKQHTLLKLEKSFFIMNFFKPFYSSSIWFFIVRA